MFLLIRMYITSMIILETKALKKSFKNGLRQKEVLKGIDLCFEKGTFSSIIGPSGSGKTTLLYALSGLESFDGGKVMLFNHDLSTISNKALSLIRKDQIGFVFQFYHLIPSLTVYENLLLRQVNTTKKGFTIDEALRAVGLELEKNKYPHMLSGGMQQKVSIARAILNMPELLFADEPTGNLDYKSSLEVMALLKDLNVTYGITIIMVTHNDQLLSYTDRCIHLLDGQVIIDDKK